eukprot:GGOE01025955.1.p1 GENE.GGOE01025955.1~~GGOE01025955.1.p1  ORF type:complete len:409 (+),score=118.20 GGOE01025955.1:1-1227(+)
MFFSFLSHHAVLPAVWHDTRPALHSGGVMEKYTKVRNVGKGGMGQCILVRDNTDSRQFIMKLVDMSQMNKKERTAALHEAKVLSSLHHPNVVQYVDSFLTKRGDQLCIVMEWADGGDLAGKVKLRRPFSEEQLLDWLIQITLAVRYCHSKRVFHRDLKSQNIFLTGDGVVKLGDFGISRVLANTCDNANTFVGTPYYLSPELVQEQPYNTPSDMWALGVLLYELMALKMPFNALDMKGLMYKILRVIYDPPPLSYSQELRALVGKLLVKEPKARLTAAELLAQPVLHRRLKALIEGPPPNSVPPAYVDSLLTTDLVEFSEGVPLKPSSAGSRRDRSSVSSTSGRKRSSSLPTVPPVKPAYRAPYRHEYFGVPDPDPNLLPAIGRAGVFASANLAPRSDNGAYYRHRHQ